MTTRPFLYIDLEKSVWREDLHPRDTFGKFSTVKGGSRVVTKKGTAGVVEKVTDTHYHIKTDEGKKSKVAKGDAIHESDFKKVEAAKAKAAKKKKATAKKAGKKQSTTKAQNKADGTHKKATPIKDPTEGKKAAKKAAGAPKKAASKPKAEPKAKKVPRAKEALEAPVLKRSATQDGEAKEIKDTISTGAKPSEKRIKENAQANAEIKEFATAEKELPKDSRLDADWKELASKLMSKPPEKRKPADIQRIAGEIASRHMSDNPASPDLARALASRRLKAMGMGQSYSMIGNKATRSENVIKRPSGLYGDLIQSGRASMYETLLSVLSGSQNPGENASIGAHVVSRMKDKMNNDLYGMLNNIPAPHEMRPALRDMRTAENELAHTLGRTPEHDEIAQHLEATSEHFRNASIPPAPKWDSLKSEWVASRGKVEDPSERLTLLKQYDAIQRTASADRHVGSEGEREVTISGNAIDEARTPDEAFERKERQKELEGALPNAMKEMGMRPESIKVWTLTHSAPSDKRNQGMLTGDEVADAINAEGGWNGKPVSRSWVAKWYKAGRETIEEALRSNHPAIAQLKLLKSFVFNNMLRNVYEFNLIKSLYDFGLDERVITDRFVRTATGNTLFEIKKSLAPTEYIGSYVTVDSGYTLARIVEHELPKGEELIKAFSDFDELQKALFSHKEGGNNAVNQKAGEYVKKNAGKYKGMANDQQARVRAKKGALTWSEELLIKNPGSAWISWGGKRILVNSGTGEVLYDSRNEAHREEHNDGAQEDKLEFHHEADEAADKQKELMDAAAKDHAEGKYGRSKQKWAEKHGVKWNSKGGEDGKGDFDLDEEGNLQHDFSKMSLHTDHGVNAFEESIGDLAEHIKEHKKGAIDEHHHKAIGMYNKLSDEDKEAYDKMSPEEREKFVGNHIADQEGVRDLMERASELAKAGKKGKDIQAELKAELEAAGKSTGSMALRNKDKMVAVFNLMGGKKPVTMDEAIQKLGAQEISRAREEANKRIVPEGFYEIGNKQNGKSMVVKIGHRIDPENGNFTTYVQEAFDPKSGAHFSTEGTENSWGQLGKALGLNANSAEKFIYESNKGGSDSVMQAMDEDEAQELRKQTSLGLKDSMLHKNFQMVDQKRDKNGKVSSTTYAQDMPDGTQNVIEVGADGYVKDPIMARLLDLRKPIHSPEDLQQALEGAVGNKIWVTAHMGSDVHIGDALGHHVQIMYDGKGAPRVVGGQYDGYRFMDAKDIPKGATDPHTGEPIKALFKNGKLVGRRASVMNEVKIDKGNAVMYQDGNSWKKGKVRDVQDGTYQVVDSKGNLIGMFKKNELQPAKEKGRTLSESGQAVVKLAKDGKHRMTTSDVFGDDKKSQKAKQLFAEALRKAKIARAFEGNVEDGILKKDIELEDKHMERLKKVLGRSKAGRELLKQFRTSTTDALEMHVPEHLRKDVEAEGVAVGKDGKARISAAKFESLRDVLGGVSIDHGAQEYLAPHFRMQDRTPRPVEDLKKDYQPSMAQGRHADYYRAQFKKGSFLLDPSQGLYGTQLEGISHLVERGRGIAGHGMGTGKTILGVMAAMHHKATQASQGKKAGKTLVVAPKGIMSDWGKEIGTHTNSKALYIGSGFKSDKTNEAGRKLWGQEGTEQEAVDFKSFKKNTAQHASEDHDFHIVSYDTFMRNREHFVGSGMYDNIAIDEVHAFKNQSGKRGSSLAETTDKFKNVWGLSGTPMENDAREVHSLVDTITGGRHQLGSKKEFQDNFMLKDKKGKIVGVKPEKAKELGDILANVVQFRGGEDVTYNDGSKIHFPHLSGAEGTPDNPNPQQDFVGNLVDRSRDHKTTDYYGTKHSITDFDSDSQKVDAGTDQEYEVNTMTPKGVDPDSPVGKMYKTYNELQAKYLPESKLKELKNAVRTGIDNGAKKGNQNYLTAMQKLQKYLNAPLAHKMYVPGGGNAIESDATDAQAEAVGGGKKEGGKKAEPIPHEVDEYGNKRYYISDGKGGFEKNADGSPKLLDPLHHNNPKADYLKKRVSTYLDSLAQENQNRRAAGKPELMPKVVVKSSYTTFGTDIVDGVLRDLQREHPELQRWADKVGDKFGAGRFTGDADDREDTKVGFRGNKKNYAEEQGHLWATTVSPAGKEGVDFGNAHYMIHFDQDWNPQKMAQFTARVRRSDSAKSHAAVGRANAVRVESLHTPGTIEDFMFDAQDKKMSSIKEVTDSTREAEKAPKLGETQGTVGYSHRGFTRGKKNKAGAKPKKNMAMETPSKGRKKSGGSTAVEDRKAVAGLEKSVKLVIRL